MQEEVLMAQWRAAAVVLTRLSGGFAYVARE
jgi:hypothetical protein